MTISLSEKINKIVSKRQQRQSLQDIDIENDNDLDRLNNYNNDENDGDEDEDEDEKNEKENEKLKKAHYVDVGESKLRKQLKKQQLELDPKYGGSIGFRKDLFQENSTNYSEDENSRSESDNGNEVNESKENESDALSFRTDSEDEVIQEEEYGEEDNEEGENEENNDNDERETRLSKIINKETRTAMNNLSRLTKIDAHKGHSILKQTKFFENIVDLRIKLQKLLNSINQLPLTAKSWTHIDNDDTSSLLKKNNKLLLKIFEKLFNLRLKFQLDDNITVKSSELNGFDKNKKKRSYDELLNRTDKLDNDLRKYRNTVLNKWSAKIQMASGLQQLNSTKFSAINQPANVQVENQLADKDRLIKRTRLNRTSVVPFNFESDYKEGQLSLLSNNNSVNNKENQDIESEEELDIPKNYDPRRKSNSLGLDLTENPYIFNDEDFYRLLLNDLLDKKLHDTTNNNGIGTNGTEIMITSNISNRHDNKIKKNIDTKASKGRKLNYSIQEPIAHFETPINNGYHWSDEQIDEFFVGLLGQKVDFNESDSGESDNDHIDEERKNEELAIKNDDIQIFG